MGAGVRCRRTGGIRARHEAGLSLGHVEVMKGKTADRALQTKAYRFFGHWGAAVEEAGIDYAWVQAQRRKYPSADAVIAEIQRRHSKGLPMTATSLQVGEHRDPALAKTAREHFGRWAEVLKAAGIERAAGSD